MTRMSSEGASRSHIPRWIRRALTNPRLGEEENRRRIVLALALIVVVPVLVGFALAHLFGGAIAEGSILLLISALVDKSLLTRNTPHRYEMHEVLRQYATEKLRLSPEEIIEVRDRHCEYYATFLQERENLLKGDKQKETLAEIGRVFNRVVRLVCQLSVSDTQCGFKMLSQSAVREIVPRMAVDRFGFDFELIILAHKLGFKVKQMPVRWRNQKDSTVTLFGPNGFVKILMDLIKTKFRLIKGGYNL